MFTELQEEPKWANLEEAAQRLAYFKSELNMLHPFREGNGRTIRIYMYVFALLRDIEWNYETLDHDIYTSNDSICCEHRNAGTSFFSIYTIS
ncbi:Fic family protein [Sporosarcina gallistercoris]|uniref:Fic family protein n=1 Tax=Sporosarcina gallistercoris TaxID=2762245 RepID=A0ABR8PJZ5_9BACL|nr:Fic family protein [Sporosarcina gallistercoris]